MKKRILTGVLSVATVLSLATGLTACNDNSGGDADIKDDGDVLTILAWTNNGDVRNMVALFCEKTGTDPSKIKIADCGASGGDASTGYETYLKGNDDADILCLEADWILKYINDDNLTASLDSIGISSSNLANPYSYTVAIGTNNKGVLKGASFQAAPGGFVYRADLAKQYLGVNTPEEMQEKVKDWASFEATAQALKDAGGPALAATEDGMWQVYQANRTKPWVVDGKLIMDNAEEFYDIAKKFYDNGYMTTDAAWSETWYNQVKNGNALGEFLSTWGMTDSDGGQLKNFAGGEGDSANMAFCAGPQEYFWGGTWLGVSTKCDNKTLAKEFIEFFTCNDEGMRAYVDKTGDYCNNKKVMEAVVSEGNHKNKYLVGGQSQFAYFAEKAGNIKMDGLITEYDATIKSLFNESVKAYAKGEVATKEEAISKFKDSVRKDIVDITVE
ncbi:MAG: carbohydrate ABC transporter substrate-binding protein [Oscillospiraceae bacterium]|nr:carbohydrate ABC transporter substrate-binding protein [Oscillospiraceae bacterium]